MIIGVISDTHIPDRAKEIPQKVLEEFKKVDMVIHVGDFVDLSVLDELKLVCNKVFAVWGNMDPDEIKQILPQKEILKVEKFRIGVMHGCGAPNKLMDLMEVTFASDNVDIIIFGHSHYSVNEKRKGVVYFNPGSVTDKVFAPFNSYGIIEINDTIKTQIVKL